MKKCFLTLFFLLNFTGLAVYAQSKKQLNAQLATQLTVEKAKYDSLVVIYNNSLSALVTARSLAGNSLYKGLGAINYSVEEERYELKKQLVTFRLIHPEEANAMEVYNEKLTNYYAIKSELEPLFDFKFEQLEKIAPLYLGDVKKLADRNTLMAKQIESYKKESGKMQSETIVILETKAKLTTFNSKSDEMIIEYDAELRRLMGLVSMIRQKLDTAKEEFTRKGPKGFSIGYFAAFPDVFSGKSSDIPVPIDSPPIAEPNQASNIADVSDSSTEGVVPPPLIYDVVTTPAEYPGGRDSLVAFLSSSIHYPEFAFNNGIGGKCYVKFVVSETGSISNVKIARGVPDCRECDEEAVRVVKLMPDWKPGEIDGKPVNQWYTLPILFKVPQKK